MIQDSVLKVEDGTRLVDESGVVLEEIVSSVKKVSDIIAEIAAASQEQSDGIGQVNRALMQMDEMTQQNASLVEEAAAASEAMGAQAEELSSLVAYFKLGGEEAVTQTVKVERVGNSGNTPAERQANLQAETQATVAARPKASLPPGKTIDDSEWEEF